MMWKIDRKVFLSTLISVFFLTMGFPLLAEKSAEPPKTEDPNNVFEAHKVEAVSKSESAGEKQAVRAKPGEEEPNFISVNGQVIRNPKKQGAETTQAASEPNYVVIDGKIVRNPRKKVLD